MTRKNVEELLPIMKAYAEGKQIQFFGGIEWEDRNTLSFDSDPSRYRIKPEPKYRSFKSVEECWNEMQKHKPFGWIKSKTSTQMYRICDITESTNWNYRFDMFMFADGTPYGIREE